MHVIFVIIFLCHLMQWLVRYALFGHEILAVIQIWPWSSKLSPRTAIGKITGRLIDRQTMSRPPEAVPF